jgi:hypothetical protein
MKNMKFLKKITMAVSLLLIVSVAVAKEDANKTGNMNWFGGETYNGAPALEVTAALIKAGGGVEEFSFAHALVSMLGEETVNAEVKKLNAQYGEKDVASFLNGMTFAVNSAIKHVTAAGIVLPPAPAELNGVALAKALVVAGTDEDSIWWSGRLFDKALSNQIHMQVMADIEAQAGHATDMLTHKILNQAMYDVAHALGYKDVKLASLH